VGFSFTSAAARAAGVYAGKYSVLVRIAIAIAILIGAVIVIAIFRRILWWFVRTWFFWLVDVVPAKGESVAEAKTIAAFGPVVWLGKKLTTDFGNWTENDTQELASLQNWRAKLFFHSTERTRKRIERLQEVYKTTGKQLGDLTKEEGQKLLGDLDYSWFEQAIIDKGNFYWILYIAIIAIAIIWLDNSVP
jgi:hypothetical protein